MIEKTTKTYRVHGIRYVTQRVYVEFEAEDEEDALYQAEDYDWGDYTEFPNLGPEIDFELDHNRGIECLAADVDSCRPDDC